MQYCSTRGGLSPCGFEDILLGGLAADGGLVVPECYPQITPETLQSWRGKSYPELALEVLRPFIDCWPETTLQALIAKTYTRQVFGSPEITPLRQLEPGLFLLELSNGPTLAFKDVAMQLLGNFFEYALLKRNRQLNVLGATSGDTGSAAAHALRGKRSVRLFMLSPHGRMSRFQTAQMYSLLDANIFNIALEGVFDEAQDLVKAVSADLEFKRSYAIGTVNSINWARVLAQVVYYVKAYLAATPAAGEGATQAVSFSVPSGNFGNVLAGHIARQMGLPIRRLVVATNENNVLDEFFRTGRYRVRAPRETRATSSPSMDISKASNFERFIYDWTGADAPRVRALWEQLEREGSFDLAADPSWPQVRAKFGFVSGASNHALRLQTIREVHARYARLIDPHTADGIAVAQAWREPDVAMICLETAQAVKFPETIHEALGISPPLPAGMADPALRAQRFYRMPRDLGLLQHYIRAQVEGAPC
jgi:threonine synthase